MLYYIPFCAVPDFQPGTRTKMSAGNERFAGYGRHGGRCSLEQ